MNSATEATEVNAEFNLEFDPFTCPLNGVNQIEASAGTGKTWNLCALYLRLLLEGRRAVDQILVVTFSRAATAELRQRIRKCISQLLHALAGGDASDPLVARLLEQLKSLKLAEKNKSDKSDESGKFIKESLAQSAAPLSYDEARGQLEGALRRFDQAAIYTIHGFCQRSLMDAPFAALRPFEIEVTTQDDELRFETAVEFWQTAIEPAVTSGFAAWLEKQGVGPAVLDRQLAQRLKKPFARLIFGNEPGTADEDKDGGEAVIHPSENAHTLDTKLIRCFENARALWSAERDGIAQALDRSMSHLNATSYKPATIAQAFDAWTRYFDREDVYATLDDKAHLLTASMLAKRVKKGATIPEHRFFDLANALVAQINELDQAYSIRWFAFVKQWLNWGPSRLQEKKRLHRMATFDDLIANLHQALVDRPELCKALKQRYLAALIDEFQDTDPLQFDLFNRIFSPHGPLFLVGDPKQAIYSFRSADLQTYLAARTYANARYTLTHNQRSTAAFITACNRIFSANPAAFILPGLNYQPVQAASKKLCGKSGSGSRGALHLWMLPHGEHLLSKHEAMQAAAHACAAEIAKLLQGRADDEKQKQKRSVLPSDIAVLVQTHRQSHLIKRVFAQWGIATIQSTQVSVFSTEEAESFERVLHAINMPNNASDLRGALTSDWFGLNAHSLSQQGQGQGQGHDVWTARFLRYRTLWHQHSFAVMWRTLMCELRIGERIAAGLNGERRLTNLMHLAELISTHAAYHPGIAPTLHWLSVQRKAQQPLHFSAKNGHQLALGARSASRAFDKTMQSEEQSRLRLESDQNLVQIMTVHKSKGLEYPIVFCPFLMDDAKSKQRQSVASNPLMAACEYHDQTGAALLHYLSDKSALTDINPIKAAIKREQAAESVRLIYVALTRAIERCFIIAGLYTNTSGANASTKPSTKQAKQSVLNWLATGAAADGDFLTWHQKPPKDDEVIASWYALASADNGDSEDGDASKVITVEPLPITLPDKEPRAACSAIAPCSLLTPSTPSTPSMQLTQTPAFQASNARRTLHETWQIASFSSLIMDADADTVSAGNNLHAVSAGVAPNDILHFPRGTDAGNCLHWLFELTDFTAPNSWAIAIERALRERPIRAPSSVATQMPAMMMRLLQAMVCTKLTPLAPGLTLASVDPAHRLPELEFTFPASVDLTALRQLLLSYGYPDQRINAETLSGYIKGSIDWVFEYDHRFWIIDWKSNHLGYTSADYQPAALNAAMIAHGYHLQALIYTLALNRYLRLRLPRYDYATHFGGYLYLFIRGVRPDWRIAEDGCATGVYADVPDAELINTLDRMI